MQVAIACENPAFDGPVFERLLGLLLEREVTTWKTDMRMSGWPSVLGQAAAFLDAAGTAGIRHALIAIDNDGGSKRAPAHEPGHDAPSQAKDDEGCRYCRALVAIPKSWGDAKRLSCVAVPVQAMETWLLCVRGEPPAVAGEQCPDRAAGRAVHPADPGPDGFRAGLDGGRAERVIQDYPGNDDPVPRIGPASEGRQP